TNSVAKAAAARRDEAGDEAADPVLRARNESHGGRARRLECPVAPGRAGDHIDPDLALVERPEVDLDLHSNGRTRLQPGRRVVLDVADLECVPVGAKPFEPG